jgi:hypothetical protein
MRGLLCAAFAFVLIAPLARADTTTLDYTGFLTGTETDSSFDQFDQLISSTTSLFNTNVSAFLVLQGNPADGNISQWQSSISGSIPGNIGIGLDSAGKITFVNFEQSEAGHGGLTNFSDSLNLSGPLGVASPSSYTLTVFNATFPTSTGTQITASGEGKWVVRAPEVDPTSTSTALVFLGGCIAILRGRRKRAI